MSVTRESLKAYVEANPRLVVRRESVKYPGLFVLKYHKRVFWDALWNEHLEFTRGAVVDKDYNLVVRPFTKIYNRFENKTDIHRDTPVLAVGKVNGFMAAATYVPAVNDVVISTTGSLDSPFADMARKHFTPENMESIYRMTSEDKVQTSWLFEVCDEGDPHIVKEEPGLYLIGAQMAQYDGLDYHSDWQQEKSLDHVAKLNGWKRPFWFRQTFDYVVGCASFTAKEGYVVYSEVDRKVLKIKSPAYLISKFFGRMSEGKVDKIINDPDSVRRMIDEEFYPLLDHVKMNIDTLKVMGEQERIEYIQRFIGKHTTQGVRN